VGVYREHVLPRLVDKTCGVRALDKYRAQATQGLTGRVVEIGFGSGLNVPHYPSDVELVYAVEPASLARRLAEKRVAASLVPVQHVGLDGQELPLDDDSCDAALCTFTLCTVPDPARALAEVRRVVRPGGSFHFLEHGLSPEPGVARWQHRMEPVQKRLFDGCHLTRDVGALVEAAGFELTDRDQGYAPGPKPWSFMTVGVAAAPSA
jgi:ubiquinone/menaquinone biosynthesis C-methylase UbiE